MTTEQRNKKHQPSLRGRGAAAPRRLISQSKLYGRFTRRLLEDAGVEEGMKVLDVGTGAGDLALMAAEMVGPAGSVVGVDQDPQVLKAASARAEAARLDNVCFYAGDFREGVPADGPFDAMVGRLVLLYVPDPAEALRGLVDHLEPGGIAAFGEFNFLPESALAHPPTPLWETMWNWMRAVVREAGFDPATGYNLRRTFLHAGLPEPEMNLCSPVGGGPDWPGYDHAAESVRSMLPLIVKLGIATEEEVEIDTLARRLRAETVAADGVVKAPDLLSAWARKT
jgi:2-polyprenyl-3-methyl-5-hydroxy-6-metoxy-1,4-benzoquinol methylase